MSTRFVLQAFDPATGSAVVEASLRVADVTGLRKVLGLKPDEDSEFRQSHELDPVKLQRIGRLSDPPFRPDPIFTRLGPWHSVREVPYLVHTNFELPLLLEERKPFAVFWDAYPNELFDALLARFDPHVRAGRVVCRVIDTPFDEGGVVFRNGFIGLRHAYFALPHEEWRIEAYILLRQVAAKTGWNESLERYEGILLGYTEWQNDWWIANRFGAMQS